MAKDNNWQSRYFSSPVSRRLRRFGLIEAPRPQAPSHARLELREQNAQEEARDAEWWARRAHEVREQREREHLEELRALVEAFGADAVEAITRRVDPSFELPDGLRDKKEG